MPDAYLRPRPTLRALWSFIREPVPVEKRRLLSERWAALDERWRLPVQGLGQQATGCGATVGVYPKCDFDCRGCYLGEEANSIPRLPLAEVLAQLDALRRHLGPKGNVQITDGEVTLLPEEELVAIVRHAREIGLTPMVMTHGDSFRRKPELLERLVVEGGLREVSIHVDSLQRGRRGWREREEAGLREEELMPLRDEFAAAVREVRRRTGIRLRAATTLTISRENLDSVPAVVDWCFRNRDVFGLISFQPLAQVGRTENDLVGVGVEELWGRVAEALRPFGFADPGRNPMQFGHPDCTRMEPFAVVELPGRAPRVEAIVRADRAGDEAIIGEYLRRGLGGLNFRDDAVVERVAKVLGTFLRAPGFFLGPVLRWIAERARDVGSSFFGLAWDTWRGKARVTSFQVVSHHFMSDDEVLTERGQERLAACIFRLPVDGEMVPMCQMNAAGVRQEFYARQASRQGKKPSPLRILPTVALPGVRREREQLGA